MTDFDNEGNMQPSEDNGANENPGYLKPDAPKFEVPVPPEQPQPAQPVYNYTPPVQQMPNTPPTAQLPKQTDGLGIASMILGILGIICCWVTFFGFLLALVGLILGLCAKRINGKKSGFAIAGIITSSIGVVLGLVWMILAFTSLGGLYNYNNFDYWSQFDL